MTKQRDPNGKSDHQLIVEMYMMMGESHGICQTTRTDYDRRLTALENPSNGVTVRMSWKTIASLAQRVWPVLLAGVLGAGAVRVSGCVLPSTAGQAEHVVPAGK